MSDESPTTDPFPSAADAAPIDAAAAREIAWRDKFGRAAYEGFSRDIERAAQSAGASHWHAWETLPATARDAWANAARAVFVEATRES